MPRGDLRGPLEFRLADPYAAWLIDPGCAIFARAGPGGGVPERCAQTRDEYVNKTASALLPAWLSGGVKHADEGTDEVVGFGVRAEIATGDGAHPGGYEGAERFKRRLVATKRCSAAASFSTSLRYTASMRSSRFGKWR